MGGKKDRADMSREELRDELLEADKEQQQATKDANSDEARWTPES